MRLYFSNIAFIATAMVSISFSALAGNEGGYAGIKNAQEDLIHYEALQKINDSSHKNICSVAEPLDVVPKSSDILSKNIKPLSFNIPTRLDARMEVNHRYGQDRAITMVEFWAPIRQDENSVLYGDLRLMGDNAENNEGNIGLGYRHVVKVPLMGEGVAGLHGWLDRRITARNSKFHQVTLGAEWLGKSVDVLANGYIPLSSEREVTIANTNPQAPALAGTGIVVDTNGKIIEEAQHGLDLEVGVELGQYVDFLKNNTDSLRLYGGGYYFNGDHTQSVAGWRTRLVADINSDIQVGARFQHDDRRGSQGFLEASIRFPFGQKKSYRDEGIRARLDESPERDIDIVTNETVIDSGDRVQVLNKATGVKQEVLHVDNQAAGGGDGSVDNPFNALADAQAAASTQTIIYVNRGDGTTAGQNVGVVLDKAGQQLIGSGTNFIYDSGRFTTANGSTPKGVLIKAATTAPVIANAAGNVVAVSANNVTVAGVTVDGTLGGQAFDGVVVEADGGAASAQNVAIKDITAQNNRFGVYVHGANGGDVSASVQDSVTTSNAQHGVAIYDNTNGTFDADLGGGNLGSTGGNVLAGNALEDLAVEMDGGTLQAQNNWWGQATGADEDTPDIGVAPQIYYGAPMNDGLVSHLTFDNEWTTNTTAYDRSGQGNDGDLLGGLNTSDLVSGEARESFDFDGSGKRVEIPDNATLDIPNNLTVLLHIDSDVTHVGYAVHPIGKLNNTTDANFTLYHFGTTSGANEDDYRFFANGGGVWKRVSGRENTLPVEVSKHIALTYQQATGGQLYVDSVATGGLVGGGALATNNRGVRIGGYGGEFDGRIDDVRIYNRVLSAAEIAKIYNMDTSSAVNSSNFLTVAP